MIMMTIIIPANTIFFLFEGFFGGGLTAFGMDEGTSGVGERSFGEKSFGMNRFSARGAFEDSEATFGGNINSGSEDGGTPVSGVYTAGLGIAPDGLS